MKKTDQQAHTIFESLDGVRGSIEEVATHQGKQFSPYDESVGDWQSPFGYAGEMQDENGLVYLRARYYNRDTGTFLSLDPHEGDITNPITLNRYAYANDNPINNTDPSGKAVCSDLTGWAQVFCALKVETLSQIFGIILSEEELLSPNARENWISERVNNVYEAVQAINARLGGLTRQSIGDTEMLLAQSSPDWERANTSLCNRMRLYLNTTLEQDVIHAVDNIIHEFGHVLTLDSTGRTRGSEALGPASDMENRPVALWDQIQNYRGFSEGEGWSPNGSRRQNPNPPDPADINAEVVADMFLYWIQPDLGFTDDSFGQVREAFMNGGDIPSASGEPLRRADNNNEVNDGSIIHSAGVQSWARNAVCASGNASALNSLLNEHPFLTMANNSWCDVG